MPAAWAEGPGLHRWLAQQGALFRRGQLRVDRAQRLTRIGVELGRQRDRVYETHLAQLERFAREHGHTKVARDPPWAPGLSQWVVVQRRTGRARALTPARRARLEAIGFEWTVPAGQDDRERWEELFERLLAFKHDHGHLYVPVRTPEDAQLTTWVRYQRVLFGNGKLAAERRARLEAAGFAFDARDAAWMEKYADLEAFKREHGHCDVVFRSGPLGIWVRHMRVARKEGRLAEARVAALDALGFSWVLRRHVDVDAMLEALAAFRQQTGHLDLPEDEDNRELRTWADAQRAAWKGGILSAPLRDALDRLDFPWTEEALAWERAYCVAAALLHRRGASGLRPGSKPLLWLESQQAAVAAGALLPFQERRIRHLERALAP